MAGPATLTSYHDALAAAIAVGAAAPTAIELLPIAAAAGAVTAEDVVVPIALPRFDGSAMDGYVLRAADTRGADADHPVRLELVSESRAGHPSALVLRPGQAMRISTGARIPAGADAVVRVEDTQPEGDDAVLVRVALTPGHDVRPAGEDVTAGEVAVSAGSRLDPGRIALLGGIGIVSVRCRRAPTVTVVATGDEVVTAGQPLGEADVHDVNGLAIPALLRAAGAGEVEVLRVGDDRAATIAALAGARGDVIVSCGGVSVGDHDHIRPALAALDAEQEVFGVALQPGKPTWIGHLGGRPVFGLPGNPASALVTAALFVAPALRAMTGLAPAAPRWGRLIGDGPGDAGRLRALRAVAVPGPDGVLGVRVLGPQHSHRLRPLAEADVLALIPSVGEAPAAGKLVELVAIPGAERR